MAAKLTCKNWVTSGNQCGDDATTYRMVPGFDLQPLCDAHVDAAQSMCCTQYFLKVDSATALRLIKAGS